MEKGLMTSCLGHTNSARVQENGGGCQLQKCSARRKTLPGWDCKWHSSTVWLRDVGRTISPGLNALLGALAVSVDGQHSHGNGPADDDSDADQRDQLCGQVVVLPAWGWRWAGGQGWLGAWGSCRHAGDMAEHRLGCCPHRSGVSSLDMLAAARWLRVLQCCRQAGFVPE